MYQSSPEYRSQLRQHNHRHYYLAELIKNDGVIGTSDAWDPEMFFNILVQSGSVTCDTNGRYRRSCNLSLAVHGDRLAMKETLGAESFAEMKIWRGLYIPGGVAVAAPQASYVAAPGGVIEYYPLGVFHPSEFEIDSEEDDTTKVSYQGVDRGQYLDKEFGEVYTIAANTTYWEAALGIVNTFLVCPNSYTTWIDTDASTWGLTPRLVYNHSDNIWNALVDLALAINKEPIWDPHGVFAFRSLPDFDTSPVEDAFHYEEVGIMSPKLKAVQDSLAVINTVDVVGSAPWLLFPVKGRASISNPDVLWSTFHLGVRAKTVENAQVTSTAQAEAIAQSELLRVAGVPENVIMHTLPDPRFESNDIVNITHPNTGATDKFIVDSFKVPLLHTEMMEWNCRRIEQ